MVSIRNYYLEFYVTNIDSNESLGLIVPNNIYKMDDMMHKNFVCNKSEPCDGCGFCGCSPCGC